MEDAKQQGFSKKRKLDEVSSDTTSSFKQTLIKKTKYAQIEAFKDNFETLKEDMIESAERGRNYHILNFQLSDAMTMKISNDLGLGLIIFPYKQLSIIFWGDSDVRLPSWLSLIRRVALVSPEKGYENILFIKEEINVELPKD